MRKALIVLGCIAGLAVVGYFAFTSPRILEKVVEWTCTQPTERCIIRMRALGHVWSHNSNLDRAAHWYERAAEAGDPASMFHLGWAYEMRGIRDVQIFIGTLARVRAPGADQDQTDEPTLSRQNFVSAARWYRHAADAGFAPAMNNLGDLYGQGYLGKADWQEAFKWHLAAAQAGNPVGAFNISLAYRDGRGVARDVAAADKWALWSPVNFKERDLSDPTLGRTRFFGTALPEPVQRKLQSVAKDGPPSYTVLDLKPMKPDPRLPTFSDVQRRATEGKGQ